jgi:hypothetical protein
MSNGWRSGRKREHKLTETPCCPTYNEFLKLCREQHPDLPGISQREIKFVANELSCAGFSGFWCDSGSQIATEDAGDAEIRSEQKEMEHRRFEIAEEEARRILQSKPRLNCSCRWWIMRWWWPLSRVLRQPKTVPFPPFSAIKAAKNATVETLQYVWKLFLEEIVNSTDSGLLWLAKIDGNNQ